MNKIITILALLTLTLPALATETVREPLFTLNAQDEVIALSLRRAGIQGKQVNDILKSPAADPCKVRSLEAEYDRLCNATALKPALDEKAVASALLTKRETEIAARLKQSDWKEQVRRSCAPETLAYFTKNAQSSFKVEVAEHAKECAANAPVECACIDKHTLRNVTDRLVAESFRPALEKAFLRATQNLDYQIATMGLSENLKARIRANLQANPVRLGVTHSHKYDASGGGQETVSVTSLLGAQAELNQDGLGLDQTLTHELGHLFEHVLTSGKMDSDMNKADVALLKSFRDCLDDTILKDEYQTYLKGKNATFQSGNSWAVFLPGKRAEYWADQFTRNTARRYIDGGLSSARIERAAQVFCAPYNGLDAADQRQRAVLESHPVTEFRMAMLSDGLNGKAAQTRQCDQVLWPQRK